MSKRNQFASCYKQENKQEKKTMLNQRYLVGKPGSKTRNLIVSFI